MDFVRKPTISFRALEKAALTIEPIVALYFPFHGLGPEDFFRHMPLLVYTEATIYQIDEDYENNTANPKFVSAHREILLQMLKKTGFLDEKIEEDIENGMCYYRLEQKMCSGESFTFDDIVRANKFKCFDFRVLHRLIYRIRKLPYPEDVLDAFWAGERLVDIEDDLLQYTQDIAANVYNTYRMMVKLYGVEAKERLQEYMKELNRLRKERFAAIGSEIAGKLDRIWQAYRCNSPPPEIPEAILEELHK